MNFLSPVVLEGRFASLYPLAATQHDGLAEAVGDGELWRLWYTAVPKPETMADEIQRRLERQAKGELVPFAVRENRSGDWVGMTSYLNLDIPNRRLEIGTTWYARRVQRTAINTECKLLLLARAFEVLDCIAVELRTHAMNHASRRAIERLGARQDGILRSHRILPDGSLRDTVVYSIVRSEWPAVRNALLFKLEGLR